MNRIEEQSVAWPGYDRGVRLFRELLRLRGRESWDVADVTFIEGNIRRNLRDFLARWTDKAVPRGFELDLCREGPILWRWDDEERALVADHVLYEIPGCVFFQFTVADMNGYQTPRVLLAAPDFEQLRSVAAELSDFSARGVRESCDIIVVGGRNIRNDRELSWDDVILPAGLKGDIRGSLEGFFRSRAPYDRVRLPYKRGFLFVGPPGNGKTMLARVIAAQAGVPCLYFLVSGREHRIDPIGEMFLRAVRLAPCILIFEDVDALFEHPGEMSYFLNLVDGFPANDGLLIIATTNRPERVEPSILNRPSRFDRVWKIDDPEADCREAYLSRLFGGLFDAATIARLARETAGFSFAYLKETYISAAQQALKRGVTAPILSGDADAAIPLLRVQMRQAERSFEDAKPMGFQETNGTARTRLR